MKLQKKGNIEMIRTFVTGLVALAVMLVVGFIVLNQISTVEMTSGSPNIVNTTHYCSAGTWNGTGCDYRGTLAVIPDSYDAGQGFVTKMMTIPTWIGILIVVVMAAVVMLYFK